VRRAPPRALERRAAPRARRRTQRPRAPHAPHAPHARVDDDRGAVGDDIDDA